MSDESDEKQAFAERLRGCFSKAGYPLKPALLTREFNLRHWGRPITVQALTKWLEGKTFPAQDKLITLAQWLRITPQALRYGEAIGERISQQSDLWRESLDYKERQLFETILSLAPEHRRVVREVAVALAKAYPPTENPG